MKIDIQLLKNLVFKSVFLYLEKQDTKENCQKAIQKLANAFHIEIKKTKRYDLRKIFIRFVKNESGYLNLLSKLYNSL